MKQVALISKISLWLYLMGICAAALALQPSWLVTPKRFFLLAMLPLVFLTLWELRDLDHGLKSEDYGELVR